MVRTHSEEDCLKKILKGFQDPQAERETYASDKLRKSVIVLAGPTCVGKTALSLRIAEHLGGEVISADSMQLYRGMDIGTAKVTLSERKKVPHHLLDVRDVRDPMTVVDYFREARRCLDALLFENKVPIITGGSGFYIHALLYGPPEGPPSDPKIRLSLQEEMEKFGPEAMYDRLQKLDPEYARTITKHDRVKIIRALEIIILTQNKVSLLARNQRSFSSEYDFRCWFLFRSREHLYADIENRCEAMIREGLIEETIALAEQGLEENPSAARAIGYRQCLEYLKGERSPEDLRILLREFKKASRHYAKRQFTWFRKEPAFRWLDLEIHDHEIAADIIMQDYLQEPF